MKFAANYLAGSTADGINPVTTITMTFDDDPTTGLFGPKTGTLPPNGGISTPYDSNPTPGSWLGMHNYTLPHLGNSNFIAIAILPNDSKAQGLCDEINKKLGLTTQTFMFYDTNGTCQPSSGACDDWNLALNNKMAACVHNIDSYGTGAGPPWIFYQVLLVQ